MADRTCPKCGKEFTKPFYLRRHLERKTPCDPIVETAPANILSCRYCGRGFTTKQSLSRHTLHYCKIANSEEGMEKLMDHTIQRQLAEQGRQLEEQKRQIAEQNAKMDRLTALLEKQITAASRPAAPSTTNYVQHIEGPATINTGPVTNVQINIRPWNGEDRIVIPVGMLRAAFTENQRLVEYCRLTDDERVDAEQAAPYVVEALVDLVRRAHADPLARNVYLSPKRADQVMICVEDDGRRWKVITLVDAIHALFDGVAGNIHKIMVTDGERAQLPFDIQASASWIPSLYEDEPEKYVARAKGQMSAHLSNCRDTLALADD